MKTPMSCGWTSNFERLYFLGDILLGGVSCGWTSNFERLY